jgi:hypothetical protein
VSCFYLLAKVVRGALSPNNQVYSAAQGLGNDYPRPKDHLVMNSGWGGFTIWEKLSGGALAVTRRPPPKAKCKPYAALAAHDPFQKRSPWRQAAQPFKPRSMARKRRMLPKRDDLRRSRCIQTATPQAQAPLSDPTNGIDSAFDVGC